MEGEKATKQKEELETVLAGLRGDRNSPSSHAARGWDYADI